MSQLLDPVSGGCPFFEHKSSVGKVFKVQAKGTLENAVGGSKTVAKI